MQPEKSKATNSGEIVIRTVTRKGEEITIIERKQEPLRIDGFDL